MTCIVGLVDDGKVYIGGDSAGVAGYEITVRADRKVFKNSEFLMGCTGSFRMGQLLRYRFIPPKRHPSVDIYEYMVTDFIDIVRDCLKAGGFAKKKEEEEIGGTFLVGYQGKLFVIWDDYQVGEPVDPFEAVGCGRDIALGVMYATRDRPPKERIKIALEAAERFSGGVCGPFVIEVLDGSEMVLQTRK